MRRYGRADSGRRIGVGSLVFAGVTRCTATSACLIEIADALEFGGPWSVDEVLSAYRTGLRVEPGETTEFKGMTLTLGLKDCSVLWRALRELAKKMDRSGLSLAALGLLKLEVPLKDFDLVFYKLDHVVKLRRDYKMRNIGAGTWEGVLYHDQPTLEQLEKVREAVLEWCLPTDGQYERLVYALDADDEVTEELAVAHRRLVGPEDGCFQINVYFEHPLVVSYASPHTSAKLWLYEDMSEVILSQHCSWSGDLRVDIENFLSYGRLLRSMATALEAKAFAWGDTADGWPMEQTIPPESLDDVEALWKLFVEALEPMLGDVSILSRWKGEFGEKFIEGWAVP